MIEKTVSIRRPGGSMEAFVVHPGEGGPHPGVILYMDMWGIRESLLDHARRVATVGYYCILPDVYYRGGKVRYSDSPPPDGTRLSFTDLPVEKQKTLRAAMDGLSNAMVLDDTGALLEFLDGEPVRKGPLGTLGFCMGGRHVLCVAGRYRDRFKATACLHGADLVVDGKDSPHLMARDADGELYCGHAELDRYAPPDVVQRLDDALGGCRVRYRSEVHPGAHHGYAMPDRDVFDKQAANRDWENIFAMFRRRLFVH